ncbi:hypothetical protein EG850_11095 [Gulosibacter macacae]|uniref:Uncharacterized protein n=1 Tax=Gulosibacter macacae TaxID=2488791 RepID=A0A3P3VTZ7_9MICO|nr:hypothetical protein [Gulosibacter macacae]RRJ85924.1 hypothetical protein EG850_11095 [Gulosibacter macacae]
MRRSDLEEAVAEARRFLDRAERALSADHDPDYPYLYGPEAAAVKRASMDLTKALPKLRRTR